MTLFIQIPCYNEEKTLALALKEIPRKVEGFDEVKILIINDGSTDRTVEVAKECGVDYIVNINHNRGLANAFMNGIEACLKHGADVIVNTDADNQYEAKDIPLLVKPILDGTADIVIGARPIDNIRHFSPLKKLLQRIGSWAVRIASATDVKDAPSGFRAFTADAAMRLNVYNKYTYTIETIIQAGRNNLKIISVPIRTNEELRPSRLMKSMFDYIKKSLFIIVKVFVIYKPFTFFFNIGLFLFVLGLIPGIRYLYYLFFLNSSGKIQSLLLSVILIIMGVQFIIMAFIGDLIGTNRKIMEDIRYRIRKSEYKK